MPRTFFFLFAFLQCYAAYGFTPGNTALNKALHDGEYFEFRDRYIADSSSMNSIDKRYYKAFYESWFGEESLSDAEIRFLLSQDLLGLNDSIKAQLLFLQFNNAFRTFRYKEASHALELINARYGSSLTDEEKESVENITPVIAALKDIPAQTMDREGDLDIHYKRDIASLIRLQVRVNGEKGKFIFDTGANLSTVCESEAERMKLRMLDAKIGVTSSSQHSVASKVAVADSLRIGNVLLRNVIFLVLPDASLKFAGGLYRIRGIIGLPVIAMLGNIEITDEGHIISKQVPVMRGTAVLGFEGNTMFAKMKCYGAEHAYVFDTGAATTIFSMNFKNAYADSIPGAKENSSHVGGAGGVQKVSNIPLKALRYELAGRNGIMKHTAIQTSGTLASFGNYYGILGENIFMSYRYLYIDFTRHTVEFGESIHQ